MAKELRWEFAVKGYDPFPIDMLRYDLCWPKTEVHDSHGISQSMNPRVSRDSEPLEGRVIRLVGLREPTEGRWNSFGWKVFESRKVTLI